MSELTLNLNIIILNGENKLCSRVCLLNYVAVKSQDYLIVISFFDARNNVYYSYHSLLN